MATVQMSQFLRRLTRGMAAETLGELTDRQLLERLLAAQDEAVFEALMRRHGPMVYRVCWRVLQQAEDTEDAFQATFLLLARKLQTVRKRDSLASWLHGVAHREALDAKAQTARRRRHEARPAANSHPGPPEEITWRELRTVLDAELGRLAEKWRLPLILCYLEGRSQEEAARQLGWSKSTLLRRLEEARAALGRRLTRRGVVWPAALSAVLLSDCVAPAALAPRLVGSTVEAAACLSTGKAALTAVVSAKVAELTEGVMKTMFLTKLKIASALLVLAVAVGGGVTSLTAPTALLAHAAPVPMEKPDPVKLELASLQGTWRRVGAEHCGEKFAAEDLKKAEGVWEIKGEQITWRNAKDKDGFQTALKINPSKQPKEIDMGPIHINGKLQDNPLGNPWANKGSLGIYELKGDTLRVCYGGGGEDGKQRPKEFKTVPRDPERFPDPHEVIMVFERVKDKKPGK